MPFLPHSIRGDNYDVNLDESYNLNSIFVDSSGRPYESTPLDEASSPQKGTGLHVSLLDMDRFIRINGLENSECTNPVYIGTGATFTPDGVLSNEIDVIASVGSI